MKKKRKMKMMDFIRKVRFFKINFYSLQIIFCKFKDKVIKFGEIAHQPPALVLPKLRQKHAANAAYLDSLNKAVN
jgi:hypothetical protein